MGFFSAEMEMDLRLIILFCFLPDFCKPQRMSVCEQTNVSYIDVSPNLSRESFDFEPVQTGGQGPLATSSPRPNEANYGNYNTQFLKFDIF